MKEVKVLAVDQKVEHVVTLATDLKASLNPIELRKLEELSLLESSEQVSLVLCLRALMVQTIEDPALQKLLVTNSDLDWVALGTVLFEPG